MTENLYLAHHGVKGMKWGVRRTPEQLGHRSPTRRELKKQYRTDVKAAKKARNDAYGKASDRFDTGQEKAYANYRKSLTDKEKAYVARQEMLGQLSSAGGRGNLAGTNAGLGLSIAGNVGSYAYRMKNAETAVSAEEKASRYNKKLEKLSDKYDSEVSSAKNAYKESKAAAKESYKKSVAAAKAKDAANYSDYKKAAQSYKKHATTGEKIVANAMGKPTAYYARRAQGMSRGQATADVFMKGNMGAMKAYGVKLSARRIYAI